MSKISSKELFVFTFFISIILFPGFGNTILLQTGKNTTMISSIIGYILGFIPLLMIIYMINNTGDKNIFNYNKEKFKFLGQIFNILYVVSIFYVVFAESWTTITFTISQYLSRTSYYLILFLLSSAISFIICKKLEVIGRTHIILFIVFLLIIFFAWIFLIPLLEYENLLPIFDVDNKSIVKTALMLPSFLSLPLISLMAIRKKDIVDPKNIKKSILFGYSLSFLFVLIFLFLIVGVFGIDMGIIFTYPEYALFKKVNAFDFIQRIENVLASTIIIAAFTSLAVLFYFLVTYVKETYKIKKQTILNIITIIICFGIPILSVTLFKNYIIIDVLTKYPIFSSFIFIVLFINFILIYLTKKKSVKH